MAGEEHTVLSLKPTRRGQVALTSAVLDPDFEAHPYLYLYYHPDAVDRQGRLVGRVARYPVVNGIVDGEEELVIMDIPQYAERNNGGALRFGGDGMLYLGQGDNERPGDAQLLGNLRGKIIRIDVRGASEAEPYRIPPDNPFVGVEGARPEIWAYGLRNPWRMSFAGDRVVVVGDMGTLEVQEVSAATAGANLGWPVFMGFACADESAVCEGLENVTMPLVTYSSDQGCAVIGGEAPYLFGDACTGRIWALETDAESESGWTMRELAQTDDLTISGFGTDEAGNVLVLTTGPILRLEVLEE